MKPEDLQLICTCSACPEQYDVQFAGKNIAYIRYRWGSLRVRPVKDDNIDWESTIYGWDSNDGYAGILEDNEKYVLENAKSAICEYYNANTKYKRNEQGFFDVGLKCPFCGEPVFVVTCDDEGNIHEESGYENDPWSGLGYKLIHEYNDNIECPIASCDDGELGSLIFDSIDEAIKIWNNRK